MLLPTWSKAFPIWKSNSLSFEFDFNIGRSHFTIYHIRQAIISSQERLVSAECLYFPLFFRLLKIFMILTNGNQTNFLGTTSHGLQAFGGTNTYMRNLSHYDFKLINKSKIILVFFLIKLKVTQTQTNTSWDWAEAQPD